MDAQPHSSVAEQTTRLHWIGEALKSKSSFFSDSVSHANALSAHDIVISIAIVSMVLGVVAENMLRMLFV